MAKQVFRKSALEKISSPDQLDKVLKVTSPMSWLALLGVTLILIAVVVWLFFGHLPNTITARGVIVSNNTSTNTVRSSHQGTVQSVIDPDTRVYDNTPVLTLNTSTGIETIEAKLLGTVTEVLVKQGDKIENHTEILRVSTTMPKQQKEMVVCYAPIADAEKIARGLPVTVSFDDSSYGHMSGWVVNVDAWAASTNALESVAGKDNNMYNELTHNNQAVCAVSCELDLDTTSVSGYKWSNEKGKKEPLSAPQICNVRIIYETVHPITKLFAQLKDIWENKQ